MPSKMQRLLAWVDRRVGYDFQFGDAKGEYEQAFYTHWGSRVAIVTEEGSVRYLGSSARVVHRYDGKGNLLTRHTLRDSLKKGEHFVYGRAADRVYARANSPASRQGPVLEF